MSHITWLIMRPVPVATLLNRLDPNVYCMTETQVVCNVGPVTSIWDSIECNFCPVCIVCCDSDGRINCHNKTWSIGYQNKGRHCNMLSAFLAHHFFLSTRIWQVHYYQLFTVMYTRQKSRVRPIPIFLPIPDTDTFSLPDTDTDAIPIPRDKL